MVSRMTVIDVFAKAREFERLEQLRAAQEIGAVPYFHVLEGPTLPVVTELWPPAFEAVTWASTLSPTSEDCSV